MKKEILITVFILILGIAVFWFFSGKARVSEKNENKIVVKEIDWENKLPEIELLLKENFPEINIGEMYPVGIQEKQDITGDGIEEALILLGSGGAYTEQSTLVLIEGEKPVLARFKQEDGEISSLIFLSGSSARHGESIKMIPGEKTILSASWALDGNGKIEECRVIVYLWNGESGLFEYSSTLSDGSKQTLCESL